MTPLELFQEARLGDAISAQTAIVCDCPRDVAERLLLCDLLAFAGNFVEVRRNLAELVAPPEELQDYLAEWQNVLKADEARQKGEPPEFLTEPPAHIRERLKAKRLLASGRLDEALDSLDDADERAPFVEGHVDGREFEGWRDTDDLQGPVLEVFRASRYVWLPVEQILKIRLENADSLRDRLYRPAEVWLTEGSTPILVFMPTLYVGSDKHPEEGIRTGAGVDWTEADGVMRGLGERTFLFGEEELGISEFKQVEIRT